MTDIASIQSAIDQLTDFDVRVDGVGPVGGGCISEAFRVDVIQRDGGRSTLFVKCNDVSFEDNFRCEAAGLTAIAASEAIATTDVIGVGQCGGRVWLVARWIDWGNQADQRQFFSSFAHDLANLHRVTTTDRIGWDTDNYLGAAPQKNEPRENWVEFFAEQRLEFQVRWANDQGLISTRCRNRCDAIINRLGSLLAGRTDETCLLHGDLWSGNYLCNADGRPVVIDPAVYYGCREAEFGMLKLFGSCPAGFYDAYQATFPMPGGWQQRVNVYVLYHLLNHLNLFGSGYLGSCESTAASILQDS